MKSGHIKAASTVVKEALPFGAVYEDLSGSARLAFVFTGLGTAWPGMARDYLQYENFSATIEGASKAWQEHGGEDLQAMFLTKDDRLSDPAHAHPALVAFQLAIVDQLAAWGLKPDAVLGHSLGEVAACYCAGILDLDSVFTVVKLQHQLIEQVRSEGGMLFVASRADIFRIAEARPELSIAAVNSGLGCVISGPMDLLEKLQAAAEAESIFCRMLEIDFAAHHPSMADSEGLNLPELSLQEGQIKQISSISPAEEVIYDSSYWAEQLTSTVQFEAALVSMIKEEQINFFLEIGPHPALSRDILEVWKAEKGGQPVAVLGTGNRLGNAASQMGLVLAASHHAGILKANLQDWPLTVEAYLDVLSGESTERNNEKQSGVIAETLIRLLRETLNWTEDTTPDLRAGFMSQGLNSILGVQFTQKIRDALGIRIPVTALFDYPNLRSLTQHLEAMQQGHSNTSTEQTQTPDYQAGIPTDVAILEQQLLALRQQQAKLDPVAVVGMACRFPGGANSLEAFWEMLRDGQDGTSEIPAERWPNAHFYDPDPTASGKTSITRGGFLQDVDPYAFDPSFFKISPAEALAMDPQQRLLLECTVEAFEHAGIPLEDLRGANVGTYLGICSDDYKASHFYSGEADRIDAYSLLGTVFSAASGRVAYTFGFQGPTISVDTACSSSLVALHLASKAIRNGECDYAVVGGVNLLLAPNGFVYFSKLRAGSPDGTCRPFDAAANGYARGEGCGVIILQRKSLAEREQNRIMGLVRGTGTNQDGESSGFTVPNGVAQQRLLRKTLQDAGLQAHDVDYLETHGTGTPLGDPIEVNAASEIYAKAPHRERPLLIGSVKSNIGHLEGAAGISGVLKTLLALQHEQLPGTLHLKNPNPEIDWDRLPIEVPRELHPITSNGHDPVAGVSAFGFSGSNAHVLLQAAPREIAPVNQLERPEQMLLLSAHKQEALRAMAESYRDFLRKTTLPWPDICHTAAAGRSHYSQRLCLTAESAAEAADILDQFLQQGEAVGLSESTANLQQVPEAAFLFTGQGSQFAGMASALYQTESYFRETLDQCDQVLRELPDGWGVPGMSTNSLTDILFRDDSGLVNQTACTQPALFAVEYSLARTLMRWGIQPSAVMGHSVGEYVAAVLAGCMSMEEGLSLIARRGQLMQSLPLGEGSMAVVFAAVEQVRQWLEESSQNWFGKIGLAAHNSPDANTISGESDAIDEFIDWLKGQSVKARKLKVSHAFHSHLMDPILDDFRMAAARINFKPASLSWISNLDGKLRNDAPDAEYWTQHLRAAVEFSPGMESLAELGLELMIEIGPDAQLTALGKKCLTEGNQAWIPTLRRKKENWASLHEALAQCYLQGLTIDWKAYDSSFQRRKQNLPTYPFQRERFFADPVEAIKKGSEGGGLLRSQGIELPLLGTRVETPMDGRLYARRVSSLSLDLLGDHLMHKLQVMPGTAYLEMGMAAAWALAPRAATVSIADVSLREAMILEDSSEQEIQSLIQEQNGRQRMQIHSRPASGKSQRWKLHAEMTLKHDDRPARLQRYRFNPEKEREQFTQTASAEEFYAITERLGYQYSNEFHSIEQISWSESGAVSRVQAPAKSSRGFQFHPGILDSCMQVFIATNVADQNPSEVDRMIVPVYFESLIVSQPLAGELDINFCITHPGEEIRKGELTIQNAEGEVIARIEGLTGQLVSRRQLMRQARQDLSGYMWTSNWRRSKLGKVKAGMVGTGQQAPALVFSDGHAFVREIADKLATSRKVFLVESAPQSKQLSRRGNTFSVNPLEASQFAEMLEQITGEEGNPDLLIQGWALDHNLQSGSHEAIAENLHDASQTVLGGTLHFCQAMSEVGQLPQMVLLTHRAENLVEDEVPVDPSQQPIRGLGNVLELEYGNARCLRIDLANLDAAELNQVLLEIRQGEFGERLAYRGKERYSARFIPWAQREQQEAMSLPESNFELAMDRKGLLEDLRFRAIDSTPLESGHVRVRVRATGLNFRDVLNALGQYPGDAGAFGLECAGEVIEVASDVQSHRVGDRIMAQVPGAFKKEVAIPAKRAIALPDAIGFEDAVTIPGAYLTAWYALVRKARLKAGDKVLIHAAAGGVGLAALHIAKAIGATVFATASKGKQVFLRNLGIEHIYNSRSLAFAKEVMEDTDQTGVDVVLNSLAGSALERSFRVLAESGRFVEMGKKGIWTEEQVREFNGSLEYFPFDLAEDGVQDSDLIPSLFAEIMPWINDGRLPLLPKTVFPVERSIDAFRYMAQARHIGKIVVSQSHQVRMEAFRERGIVQPGRAYLLSGGLGALGSIFTDWLIGLGATHFAMINRSQPNERQLENIRRWEAQGVTVKVYACDVAIRSEFAEVFQQIEEELPQLAGVIHCAGVLDDAMIASQNWAQYQKVLQPKVEGGWNLHELSAHLDLDFFICFSSIAAVFGNRGQSNYSAANLFLDGLAQYRRQLGLAGSCVNWGPWGEAGMATDMKKAAIMADQGFINLRSEMGTDMMERMIEENLSAVAFADLDMSRFLPTMPASPRATFFSEIEAAVEEEEEILEETGADFWLELASASASDRPDLVRALLQRSVAAVLKIREASDVDTAKQFRDLGFDSLTNAEFVNRVDKSLQIGLPQSIYMDAPSVNEMTDYLMAMPEVSNRIESAWEKLPEEVREGLTAEPASVEEVPPASSAPEVVPEKEKQEELEPVDEKADLVTETTDELMASHLSSDSNGSRPKGKRNLWSRFVDSLKDIDS